MPQKYLEEAKGWVEDFFVDESDIEELYEQIEEMYGAIELGADGFKRVALQIKAALINGTDIPSEAEEIRDDLYEAMRKYESRRIMPSLLEKYKDEIADQETSEAYNEMIGEIGSAYLSLIERLKLPEKGE